MELNKSNIKNKRIKELEDIIYKGSKNVEDYFLLGNQYLDCGDFDKLLSLYDNLLKLTLIPIDKAQAYYERGEAYNFNNEPDKAKTSYEKSYQLLQEIDDSIKAVDLRGLNKYNLFILLPESDIGYQYAKEAIGFFKILIEKYNVNEKLFMTYSYLADIFYRLGEYDNALHYYTLALEDSEDTQNISVWVLSGIATVYGKKNNIEKAIQFFNEALSKADIDTPVSRIYFDMGMMYFTANMFDNAYNPFQDALKSKNKDPRLKNNIEYEVEILWHIGSIAYETDKYVDIIKVFGKILDIINSNHHYYANSHLILGHYYCMIGNNAQAIEHYNTVLIAPIATKDDINMAKDCLKQIPLDERNGVAP